MRWCALLLAGAVALGLAGCGNESDSNGNNDAPAGQTAGATGPEATPADPAKLVFVFQRQKDPEQTRENADAAAAFLTERLGITVEPVVPGDYSASVQALVSEQADVAYVSSLPFLLARRDADARLLVAEVRADAQGNKRTNYDSVWVVRDDSDLQSMDDVAARASSLKVAFTSRTSTSGFVMATLRLVREGILEPAQDPSEVFDAVAFAGGYTQALEQVLAGRADLCAVSFYTVEGPTADVYTTPEQRAQLRILTRTPEVPTHLVCVRGGISEDLSERITEALLALSTERPELLANVYGATEFRRVDGDEHIASLLEAMEGVGMPVDSFVK
ncbi:MAG: phosphate/phosphite/phosphonate ABC transporter substrate-binding protein [Phycisphaerales bacterium]